MTASRPDSPTLAERASGALLAHAAGNALGVPTEFLDTPEAIRAEFPGGVRDILRRDTPGSPFDDDVAMALLLAEELLAGEVDLAVHSLKDQLPVITGTSRLPDGEDGVHPPGGSTVPRTNHQRRRTMRMLMKVSIPVESGNKGVKEGLLPKTVTEFVDRMKPESCYFIAEGGKRTAYFVFDLKGPTLLPTAAEPFFMNLNAEIDITPAMNLEDVKQGVEKAMKGR